MKDYDENREGKMSEYLTRNTNDINWGQKTVYAS